MTGVMDDPSTPRTRTGSPPPPRKGHHGYIAPRDASQYNDRAEEREEEAGAGSMEGWITDGG